MTAESPESPAPARVDRSRPGFGRTTGTAHVPTEDGRKAIPFLHLDDLSDAAVPADVERRVWGRGR